MLRRQRKLSYKANKYAGNRKTNSPKTAWRSPDFVRRGAVIIEYMCGIIGYTGAKKCVPILIEGLKTLEYRGYDSAGVTVADEKGMSTVKSKGRIADLESKLMVCGDLDGCCGIGHTRWATHGEPSDRNSHPHSTESLSMVHNGIIENYAEIEEMLRGAGYDFVSETDTERACI